MMTVRVTTSLPCGCTEALIDDDGRLVVATANACRGGWWCECVDPLAPEVCEHAVVLLTELGMD
jgi:hypothetical protein